MQTLRVALASQHHQYHIRIGRDLRLQVGESVRRTLNRQTQQIAIVSNHRVFALYGADIKKSLREAGFRVMDFLISDGERFKNLGTLERIVDFLAAKQLERDDAVLTLGGGVVGDAGGFAAAIYLRGIPVIQMPTSLLAQIDASVGGKTGVNLRQGKNLAGAFYQPSAVVIDTETLKTLPKRELVSGFCEAVKQGAVASRGLFQQTTDFLMAFRSNKDVLSSGQMDKLIASHCAFKASVVSGDERESTARTDRRARRVLNFGHSTAHALEAVTGYRRFRHGEAVGHGMLVAGELSKNLGLLDQSELKLLREAVRLCGPLPAAHDIDTRSIIAALSHDKKSIRGRIQWVLLDGIGHPRIVPQNEISPRLLRLSLQQGLRN